MAAWPPSSAPVEDAAAGVGATDWDKIPVEQEQNDAESHHASGLVAAPWHPVPCLQGPFEESMMESMQVSQQRLREKLDAEVRRRQLLELDSLSDDYSSRWRQKPGAKFHPLWKLIAQMSFGIHLLHTKQAKSEDEVIRILQSHVDEVDSFVEDTTADFELALKDIEERINYLDIPLGNGRVFNKMLCDRAFRAAIIDGNDIIERVIDRTARAMDTALRDIDEGIGAVTELSKFLDRIGRAQVHHNTLNIYNTMQGNVEGWAQCFVILQAKSDRLTILMSELATLVDEVAKRAGIASRRNTPTGVRTVRKSTQFPSTPDPSHRSRRRARVEKPLPPDPMHKALAYAAPALSPQPSTQFCSSPQRRRTTVAFLENKRESSSPHRPENPRSKSNEEQNRSQPFETSPAISITRASVGLGIENTAVVPPTAPTQSEDGNDTRAAEKYSESDSSRSSQTVVPEVPLKSPRRISQTSPTRKSPRQARPLLENYDSYSPSVNTKISIAPFSPNSLSIPVLSPFESIAAPHSPRSATSSPQRLRSPKSINVSLSPLTSNPVSPQRSCFNEIIKSTLRSHVEEITIPRDGAVTHEEPAGNGAVTPSSDKQPSLSCKSTGASSKTNSPMEQDSAYSSGLTTCRPSEELPSLGFKTSTDICPTGVSPMHSPGAHPSITALPSFDYPANVDDNKQSMKNRKPSFNRKSSIASFKSMFAKKAPVPHEERIISSGGLGGCVLLTEM